MADTGKEWPGPREGFTATSSGTSGWWCDRCGALVHPNRADAHDAFHDNVLTSS